MNPEEYDDKPAYRLAVAKRLLKEVDVNVQYEFWNSAMNRMYYACFHAVSALLFQLGITGIKKHSGVKQMFAMHVISAGLMEVKWSHFYSALFECRSEADYEDFKEYTKEEVMEILPMAREFVENIECIMQKNVN